MAFVARCNVEGKVVERQQLSGRGSNPLPMSDISDEDDTDSMSGYSNRTYGAPSTVRYVGEDHPSDMEAGGGDTDVESSYTYCPDSDGNIDVDSDSVLDFCNLVDECEREEKQREAAAGAPTDEDDSEELKTVKSRTMNQDDWDHGLTDTETVLDSAHDGQSVSSFESLAVTVTQPSADTQSVKSNFSRESMQSIGSYESLALTEPRQPSEDNQSGKTYFCRKEEQDCDTPQLTSRTYDMGNGSIRIHDGSSDSACSWSDMYGGAIKVSESRSNFIPSLSLHSNSSDNATYYKSLEEDKQLKKRSSVDDWHARKERQKQEKLLKAKLEKEKREADDALRQRLSKEQFEKWCKNKDEQQKKKRLTGSVTSRPTLGKVSITKSSTSLKSMPKETPEETKKRFKEWERIKAQKQQNERERQRQQEERKQKLEEERKQKTEGAWKNWMKKVDKRAKPVPLNQGIDTLRGTVSNIYINPIKWVSNIDPKDSRGR